MHEHIMYHFAIEWCARPLADDHGLPRIYWLVAVVEWYGVRLLPYHRPYSNEAMFGEDVAVDSNLCLRAECHCPAGNLGQHYCCPSVRVNSFIPFPEIAARHYEVGAIFAKTTRYLAFAGVAATDAVGRIRQQQVNAAVLHGGRSFDAISTSKLPSVVRNRGACRFVPWFRIFAQKGKHVALFWRGQNRGVVRNQQASKRKCRDSVSFGCQSHAPRIDLRVEDRRLVAEKHAMHRKTRRDPLIHSSSQREFALNGQAHVVTGLARREWSVVFILGPRWSGCLKGVGPPRARGLWRFGGSHVFSIAEGVTLRRDLGTGIRSELGLLRHGCLLLIGLGGG